LTGCLFRPPEQLAFFCGQEILTGNNCRVDKRMCRRCPGIRIARDEQRMLAIARQSAQHEACRETTSLKWPLERGRLGTPYAPAVKPLVQHTGSASAFGPTSPLLASFFNGTVLACGARLCLYGKIVSRSCCRNQYASAHQARLPAANPTIAPRFCRDGHVNIDKMSCLGILGIVFYRPWKHTRNLCPQWGFNG